MSVIKNKPLQEQSRQKFIPKLIRKQNKLLAIFYLSLGTILFIATVVVHCLVIADIENYTSTFGGVVSLIIGVTILDGTAAFNLIAGVRFLKKSRKRE